MNIEQWWPRLKPATQEWLIANNGDAVPSEMVAEIAAAGGGISSDAWWVGQTGPNGFFFSDDATDWIEAVANSEEPEVH